MNRQQLDELSALSQDVSTIMGKVYDLYSRTTNRPQSLLAINKTLNTARSQMSDVLIDEWRPPAQDH